MNKFIVIIRPEFMLFCKDACQAAALNHLLFRIAGKSKDAPQEKIISGDILWYAKNEQIVEEMSNAWGLCKVRQEVNRLIKIGLIGRKNNPEWGADRTKHFCFGEMQCRKFLAFCEMHQICVVHLELPNEVKHLIYSSNANDKCIKCICSIHQMELMEVSNANDKYIEAIPKEIPTEDRHTEEESTIVATSAEDRNAPAFAIQIEGYPQFYYHDFCNQEQDRGCNDGLTLIVRNLADVPRDAECQICYKPVHGPHGYFEIGKEDAPANVYHFEAEKKRITNGRIPAVKIGDEHDLTTSGHSRATGLYSDSNCSSSNTDYRHAVGYQGDGGRIGEGARANNTGSRVASHSQVDIGNFEGEDEEDFEGETVPRIEAMPKQQTPGAGSPPAATPPGGSTAASVQASRPGPPVDAAQRTASSPGTPSGAVQASVRDEKPPMALTAKQIEKQLQKRQDEILALYASKIGRKPSRSKANLDGALKLAQDDATDEDIGTTIDAILADSFLAKNLSLTFVHSKLDALARKPIPIENKQKAPAKDQNIGVSGLPRLQVRKMNYGA